MTTVYGFSGQVLDDTNCLLGEGPTYDPRTDTAWWFSILASELHELNLASGEKRVHTLPAMGSVLARVDDATQVIATEHGLYRRNVKSGDMDLIVEIEKDRPDMRSNDGRVHPSGALWYGTMKKDGEGRAGAGTIYHVAGNTVTPIVRSVGIPNAICFSPDGATGYFVDTMDNKFMKVALDPATGLPLADPVLFSDESGEPGGVDGAVCDADGRIWNARWGIGEIHCYNTDGSKAARYKVPAGQTTCPAFIGKNADRLLITSATEGMEPGALRKDPTAGQTFDLGITVRGRFEPDFRL